MAVTLRRRATHLPHSRGIPRPRALRGGRGTARRPPARPRRHRHRPGAAPARLRARRADEDRDRPRAGQVRAAPRPHHRQPADPRDHQPRLPQAGPRTGWRSGSPTTRWSPSRCPRPGHADLAGMLKYGTDDLRPILERASARETAARVAAGGVAKAHPAPLRHRDPQPRRAHRRPRRCRSATTWSPATSRAWTRARCDVSTRRRPSAMKAAIKAAGQDHNTLGGVFEVWAFDPLPGLGLPRERRRAAWTAASARRSWASRRSRASRSAPASSSARIPGSEAHDEIFHDPERGFFRRTNRSGGHRGRHDPRRARA